MGVTYKQGKIMKNIYKSFALLCMGLAATACIEENFENNGPKYDTTPGNEIVFSATAGIESGDKKTRTVYGDQDDPTAAKGWIEINWVNDDMIAITSPQSGGPKVGHYKVTGANQDKPETTDKNEADDFNSNHAAESLTRLGDAGLQWSEETKYTFYAAYPSFAYDTDKSHGAKAELTEDGVLTGSMPIDQNYTLTGDSANGWVAAPDMRYSFMTASMTDYDRTDEDAAINLEFKSMVTALQFDIKPDEINVIDPVTGTQVTSMEVISVSLSSDKNITGDFSYDIPTEEYESIQNKGTRIASLHFDKDPDNPVILKSDGASLNVTFFILPEDFRNGGRLQLQVIFKLGNTQMSRIATINASTIAGGKKYIFNNVLLPKFKNDVPASSWWDTLDPNTILPQISIPIASNVFASSLYGTNETKNQQQTLSIENLWAMGVRGFEICNQSAAQGGTAAQYDGDTGLYTEQSDNAKTIADAAKRNLGPCRVVAAESFVGTAQNMTFHSAFHQLCGLLKQPSATNECLIIICTYMSVNDGYSPYSYVANLINYLEWYCTEFEGRHVTKDDFKIIDSETTVGDLRGKVSIIIRPGDDERWLAEDTDLTRPSDVLGTLEGSLTGMIPDALSASPDLSSNWSEWEDKVMFISDWGSASFDVWDRRYGSEYARSARFNQQAISEGIEGVAEKPYIENYLYGVSSGRQTVGNSSQTYTYAGGNLNNFNNYAKDPVSMPTKIPFNFEHSMSNSNKAYVQEWARVIKDRIRIPVAQRGYGSIFNRQYYTLWVDWPSSLKDKKDAIKDLFEASILTKNTSSKNLYVNVLSGYFADYSVSPQGTYPHKDPMDGFTKNAELLDDNGDVRGHGKGGDYYGLATELNKYVYNLLSSEPGSTSGLSNIGPWGLVMMDHIKANDVSADLVELIMMNNFKFPLVTKDGVTQANYNATYSNGGEAISFK